MPNRLLLGLIVCGACASCGRPRHSAEATLEIRLEASGSSSPGQIDELVRAQAAMLRSPSLLEEAIAKLPEQFRNNYDAKDLSARLEAKPVRNSMILKLGLSDPDPFRAAQIVNAIVSIYLSRIEKSSTFSVRVIEAAK